MESRKEFQTPTSIVLSGLFLFLLAVAAYAQVDYSTGTLRGTVTDPQGAVVPGATIGVTNAATRITKTTKSLSDGTYQVPALQPGKYQISFEAAGFTKLIVNDVELTVGQSLTYDAHLKIGTTSEIIEVGPDTIPLIQVTRLSRPTLSIIDRWKTSLTSAGASPTMSIPFPA